LLVEEDTVVRKMVAGILTADGYRVLAAAEPVEALRLARRQGRPVELLITTRTAPGDEAEKLIRAMLAVRPTLRVLATGGAEPPAIKGLAPGAQGTLAKPFALSDLLHAVRSLLDGKGVPSSSPAPRPT
jgi:DNA-binding response OmpR family regulator